MLPPPLPLRFTQGQGRRQHDAIFVGEPAANGEICRLAMVTLRLRSFNAVQAGVPLESPDEATEGAF
jgi:hypothetical protein